MLKLRKQKSHTAVLQRAYFKGNRALRLTGAFLTVLLLLVNVLPVTAKAEAGQTKQVRVAMEDSHMYVEMGSQGVPVSGYGYEYIQKIAAYADWEVTYVVGGSFSHCMEMVESGEADLFYDITRTEERESRFLFPNEPMGTEEYYFYRAAGNSDISGEDETTFNGKTVGVTEDTVEQAAVEAWAEKHGVDLITETYANDTAKAEALRTGQVDMICEISLFADGDSVPVKKVSSTDIYLIANLSRQDLIDDINTALEKITDVDPFFVLHLKDEYFAKAVLNTTLSKDEAAWLEAHSTLNVGYMDNYMPFSDTEEDGNVTGIVKDLIPKLLAALGIEDRLTVNYVAYQDNDSMYLALKEGEVDTVFPTCADIDYSITHGGLNTESIIDLSADLVYAGSFGEGTVAIIAVTEGNLMQEHYTRKLYPNAGIVAYASAEECLKAVMMGKAGATVLNGMRTQSLLATDESYSTLSAQRLEEPFSFSFGVASGNAALLSLLNRAIAATPSDTAYNLILTYSAGESTNAFITFLTRHKTLLLSIAIGILAAFLGAAVYMIIKLEKTKRELDAANKAKTAFLFNMSHDIRTPMNAVMGFTEMAKKNVENKQAVVDCLDKTQQAGNLLLSLVNSVLEMSSIESGKVELNEKPGMVEYSFTSIRATLMELAKIKDIDLTFTFGNIQDHYVYADVERAPRVFINIISNAIKYTNNGGRIRVTCEQVGRKENMGIYRYTFEDNGIGMSDEFQTHLFEEFAREKNTTASGVQGTGLGLSVAKGLIDLMGGTIEWRSIKGEGTTFIVTLPFRIQTEEERQQYTNPETMAQETARPATERDIGGKRVLLVEDNEMNREIASFVLSEQKLLVEEADDGTVAVKLLREKGPEYYDAILMDIQMPQMDGYEATRQIRAMYPGAKIPIIAVSANAFAEDKAKSLEAGMDDHIPKPINAKDLIASLNKFMR